MKTNKKWSLILLALMFVFITVFSLIPMQKNANAAVVGGNISIGDNIYNARLKMDFFDTSIFDVPNDKTLYLSFYLFGIETNTNTATLIEEIKFALNKDTFIIYIDNGLGLNTLYRYDKINGAQVQYYNFNIPFSLDNYVDIECILQNVHNSDLDGPHNDLLYYFDFITYDILSGYEGGFYDGYSDGYSDGVTDGYNDGYSVGQGNGYDTGYNTGYSDGYNDGLDTDIFNLFNKQNNAIANGTVTIIDEENDIVRCVGNYFAIEYNHSGGWYTPNFNLSNATPSFAVGTIITISADVKLITAVNSTNMRIYLYSTSKNNGYAPATNKLLTLDTYVRISQTFTITDLYKDLSDWYPIFTLNSNTVEIKNIQINEGTNTIYHENPYQVGYDNGYFKGHSLGFDSGYIEGTTQENVIGWLPLFFSGFVSIFSLQIFPNITLGTLVGIPLLLGFILLIFKLKGGG